MTAEFASTRQGVLHGLAIYAGLRGTERLERVRRTIDSGDLGSTMKPKTVSSPSPSLPGSAARSRCGVLSSGFSEFRRASIETALCLPSDCGISYCRRTQRCMRSTRTDLSPTG